MAQKLIPWNTGSGNIVVNYSGSGNDTVTVGSDTDNAAFTPRSQSITVRTTAGASISRTVTVTQTGKVVPVGTIYNFAYTGTVQEVTLSAGTYKLQCWGAQGGTNSTDSTYGITAQTGGKGGYSEGILTLDAVTTLYIFVGGQGSSSGNGGWNGGGGTRGSSSYTASDYYLKSAYACGGGATDIALTTSTMSYSSFRTDRSSASYLSRFIVAGGGSGGAMGYKEITTTTTSWTKLSTTIDLSQTSGTWNNFTWSRTRTTTSGVRTHIVIIQFAQGVVPMDKGHYKAVWSGITQASVATRIYWSPNGIVADSLTSTGVTEVTREFDFEYDAAPSSTHRLRFQIIGEGSYPTGTLEIYKQETTTTTTTETIGRNGFAGGGIEGEASISTYQATQNSAGLGGGFGYGGNNYSATVYGLCSGAAGGGWYGGGTAQGNSSTSTSPINGGGGSGFVNISANAQYRPTGYTGLELDSGATYAGDTSFPSTSGSTETGHEGNGYARITCVDPNVIIPLTFEILGSGTIGWKASSSSGTKTIQYSKNGGTWTNLTSTTSGATISVANGDTIQFRGDNSSIGTSSYYNYFTSTCNFNVRGNLLSLLDSDSFTDISSYGADNMFRYLFYNCTGLLDASGLSLPSFTRNGCYSRMMQGCTGLVKAPNLPSTSIATYSYYHLFDGCSSLNYVKCLATSGINTSSSTTSWMNGVASSGTFVKASGATWPSSTSGIPSGWTVQNA